MPGLRAQRPLMERVFAGCVFDLAEELAGGEVVGGDGAGAFSGAAAGELADEQGVAKDAEVEGRKGYSPGRIEPWPCSRRLRS